MPQMLRHRIEQTLWPHTEILASNPNMELVNVDDRGRPAHIPTIGADMVDRSPHIPVINATPQFSDETAVGGLGGLSGLLASEPVHASTAVPIIPSKITDRAVLKELLKERGIKIVGNPSVKGLQDKLAAALA